MRLRLTIAIALLLGTGGCGVNGRVFGLNTLNGLVDALSTPLESLSAGIAERLFGAGNELGATDLPRVFLTTTSVNLDRSDQTVAIQLSQPMALEITMTRLKIENNSTSVVLLMSAPTSLTLESETLLAERFAPLFPANENPAMGDPEQETNASIVGTVTLIASLSSDDTNPTLEIPVQGTLRMVRTP